MAEKIWMIRLAGLLLFVVAISMILPSSSVMGGISFSLIWIAYLVFIILFAVKKDISFTIALTCIATLFFVFSVLGFLEVIPFISGSIIMSLILAIVGLIAYKKHRKFLGFLMMVAGLGLMIIEFFGIVLFQGLIDSLIELLGSSETLFMILTLVAGILLVWGGSFVFKFLGVLITLYGAALSFGVFGFSIPLSDLVYSYTESGWWGILLLFIGIVLLLRRTRMDVGVGGLAKSSARKLWEHGKRIRRETPALAPR